MMRRTFEWSLSLLRLSDLKCSRERHLKGCRSLDHEAASWVVLGCFGGSEGDSFGEC